MKISFSLFRAPLAALVFLFDVGSGLAAGEIALSAEQQRALGITTANVHATASSQAEGLAAQVVVPTGQQHVVAAPVAGLVEALQAAVGQTVRAGNPLVRLQSTDLAEMQRNHLQARAQLELARASLSRDEKLLADGIIAESRYQATRTGHSEARAAADQTRQALLHAGMTPSAMARLESGNMITSRVDIRAPASGVVIEQLASVGQRVEAAAPLYRLAKLDPLWLEIQVPVARLAGIRIGSPVSVPAFDASGRVLTISPGVDMDSQTAMVRARIDRGAASLRPGQYVEASLEQKDVASAWSIPRAALVRVEGKTMVFVRTPGGFQPETVELVSESAGEVLVTGAFKESTEVAASGVSSLKARLMGLGEE